MKNIVLSVMLITISGCTFISSENKNVLTKKGNDILISQSNSNEIERLSLVFEIPIKKGEYLEIQREDNGEYPEDFQVKEDILFVLSAEEKKVIGYNKSTNQFITYDKINQKLANEKQNGSTIRPIYLRILKDYIVVGYDFGLLIFSQEQDFLYQISFETWIQYITCGNDFIYVWCYDFAEKIDLGNTTYRDRKKIEYGNIEIRFTDIIVPEGEKLATQSHIYSIEANTVFQNKIERDPCKVLPEVKRSEFSLNSITPEYYVWYPWTMGSKLVLTNRESETSKVIDLGLNLTKNNLYYQEDAGEGGLKIINSGNVLYALIMIFENGQKKIKAYQINIS
jgi:hypothetical protein